MFWPGCNRAVCISFRVILLPTSDRSGPVEDPWPWTMWQEPQLPWFQKNWLPRAASPGTMVCDAGELSERIKAATASSWCGGSDPNAGIPAEGMPDTMRLRNCSSERLRTSGLPLSFGA